MISLPHEVVETEIRKIIGQIKQQFKLDQEINGECVPGNLEGVTSHILVTVTSRIATALGIVIPNSCYIFHNKKDDKQLSIKDATKKLIKFARNGK